ncbi:hypothetical protein, partial [Pseudopedobacter sp.]|uniref:hypothetical protein n=1 Tax=Pseudopedobacter sp. TaxID=1936787 RepID=UPI00333F2A27
MHAHSHFAFSGWVSQAIMVFLILIVTGKKINESAPSKYQFMLIANYLASVGMLVAFSITGYSGVSIGISCCVVLVSYWFSLVIWKDLNQSSLPNNILIFIKAAIIFGALSSLGTYALAYLKATHNVDPLKQLASVYFYLHFQYNGWFFFGCLALVNYWVYQKTNKTIISTRFAKLFVCTVIPSYFLSVLWWKNFPDWLYVILIITVVLQLSLWLTFILALLNLKKQTKALNLTKLVNVIWFCVVCAVVLKFILQSVSIIPSLSQLVYGFRSIVIAYLHLVLLLIISLFLIGYSFQNKSLKIKKGIQYGVYGLLFGIILNETMLMLQGVGGLLRYSFHGTHEGLAL